MEHVEQSDVLPVNKRKIAIINQKFLDHKVRYLLQALAISLLMSCALYFVTSFNSNSLLGVIGASSVAASAFIAIMMPQSPAANPRNMLGGYLIGTTMGIIFHGIIAWFYTHLAILSMTHYQIILGSLSVGVVALIMIMFSMEHPPAVGFTLGLVLEDWDVEIISVIVIVIIVASLIRQLIKNYTTN